MVNKVHELVSPDDLCYPILLIGARFMEVVYSSSSLCSATNTALKNRVYENSTCFDSEGRQFKFKKVNFVRYKPPFFGFRIFKGREVVVDLSLGLVRIVDLQELISTVQAKLPFVHWGAADEFIDELVAHSRTVREFIMGLDGGGAGH